MKQIKIAKNSGFCFGVKRAIKLAEETASLYEKAVTLGPIIHNPQMVEHLSAKGILEVNNVRELDERPVIIRSHGIPLYELELIRDKGIPLIDATCPYVSKAFDYAKKADEEGYEIFILGNPDHPEIIALKSYIKGQYQIINNDFDLLPEKRIPKAAIICQTTQNSQNLEKLVCKLLSQTNELRVFNTICNATNIRQDATIELAQKSDLLIVIGGKNSSNTKMLATLSAQYTETYHIETAAEINSEWFLKAESIGLTAGASTPDWIILDVYNKIIEIVGNKSKYATCIEDIPGYKEEIL